MANILIICGGTGGHLTPGIAVAQRFADCNHSTCLVISAKQVDKYFCRKYEEMRFVVAPGVGFSWSPVGVARFLVHTIKATGFSFRFLTRERPDALVAFGGFLSVSFIIAAACLRIPLFLHEANRYPGKAIRMLARLSTGVYLPEGVKLLGLKPGIVRHVGVPLRKEIRHIPKDQVREEWGLPRHDKVLVVIGGSQGAQVLNDWVGRNAHSLAGDGIHVICLTGPGKGEEKTQWMKSDDGRDVMVKWIPFSEQMTELYSLADLVVCRSGAGTLAELTVCLCPSIQIPFPYSADRHQEANARDLERRGGCVLVHQKENLKGLYREVTDLIFNDWLLTRMRENLRALLRADAAETMVNDIEADLLRIHRRIAGAEQEGAAS